MKVQYDQVKPFTGKKWISTKIVNNLEKITKMITNLGQEVVQKIFNEREGKYVSNSFN